MTRPVQGQGVVDDLLTRREALSTIIQDIPLNERNLRRIVGEMQKSFDSTLDDVLGKQASELREGYAQAIKPTQAIIDAMTIKQGGSRSFSPDRAKAFFQQATSDLKFDNRALLQELDSLVGTDFAKTAEAIGLDKAISQLDPPTKSRIMDVAKVWVISKIPVLSAVVSPKFWGEIALSKGTKALNPVQKRDEFLSWLISNVATMPVRQGSTDITEQGAEQDFMDQYGAEPVEDSNSAGVDAGALTDEQIMELYGGEPL